jgi:hypothetical protein
MHFTRYNSNLTHNNSQSKITCNFASYYSRNYKKNVDYSIVLGIPSSIVYGKPLLNTSYALRLQRLRILLK